MAALFDRELVLPPRRGQDPDVQALVRHIRYMQQRLELQSKTIQEMEKKLHETEESK